MVRTLLKHGGNVNLANRDGQTALHYAVSVNPPSHSQTEIVDLLLAAGTDIRKRDVQGRSALHLVAACGYATLAGRLVTAGAELNVVEKIMGETAISTAAAYDHYDVMRVLAESGADVNVADKHIVSPLHKSLSTRGRGNVIILS